MNGLLLGVTVVAAGVVTGLAVGFYRTRKVERNPANATFQESALPQPLPNGFLKGSQFTGLGKGWRGKVFDAKKQTGINQFADGQRYTFKTYPASGLRDPKLQVLRIDYKQPGNPWWLRFITDEIVQTAPGHYLGKIHVQVFSGLPFTLGYFELAKS